MKYINIAEFPAFSWVLSGWLVAGWLLVGWLVVGKSIDVRARSATSERQREILYVLTVYPAESWAWRGRAHE